MTTLKHTNAESVLQGTLTTQRTILVALALALLTSPYTWSQANPTLDFNRDVRPIFSDKCFKCHGPDQAKRKAELRFDQWQVALDKGVVDGETPADTPLLKRIGSKDPDFHMPPPEANLTLTQDERNTIIQWVSEGANVKPFWAFIPPPREIPPPQVSDPNQWIKNPIDAFILNRLNREGLTPTQQAGKQTLLRRATIDLTGLPPTIDAMDAFLKNDSPQAYEQAVDRLLNSPAFGERLAAEWLDVARYADTYGYQSDRESRVWPWREWLIGAFNDNLPYDEFITHQLAGDLLPNPTQDQILATAFNRLHRQTNEGGSVLEEFRVEYVVDRTNTFATAFLGLSLECARCHDHKFDPITQREYYQLTAFFNNIDESGMYSHYTSPTPSPAAFLYKDEDQRRKHQLLKENIANREQEQQRIRNETQDRFREWLASNEISTPNVEPTFALDFEKDELEELTTKKEGPRVSLPSSAETIEGKNGQAIRFNGDDSLNIHEVGLFERTDPFSFSLIIKIDQIVPWAVVFHRSKAAEDAASRGYEFTLQDGKPTFSLTHFWPGNALRIQAQDPLNEKEWTHIVLTYDGSSRAKGARIYVNGEQQLTDTIRDGLYKTIQYSPGGNDPPIGLAARSRDTGLKNGAIDDFKIYDKALTPPEIFAMPSATQINDPDDLFPLYLQRIDPQYAEATEQLHQARVEESEFAETLLEIMVMREMPQRRQAYILDRGEYSRRKEPVDPGTPSTLPPFSDDLPPNRLGLAKWLTDPDHPLTARVAVNRFWKIFFDTGLVQTQEDFGSQGMPPSHPRLLDYLARHFINSGWDTKKFCKLIVTSATYRQNSDYHPQKNQRDPQNILLARGPRHRMSAEQIRDAALAASGLLVPTIGGPSVKPYQPPGLWKEASSQDYKADTGQGLYRRGIYTFWKRTVPPPTMLTFDAPSREVCIARRQNTTTPLQALILLNDPQYVEAARALAQRSMQESDSDKQRLTTIYRRLLSRYPTPNERAILNAMYKEQANIFQNEPQNAQALITVGDTPPDENLDPVQLAAYTAVAQAIMNFDEFVTK